MEENCHKNNVVSALEVLESLKQSMNNQERSNDPSSIKCYSNFGSMDFQSSNNSSETKSNRTHSNKNLNSILCC